MPKIDGLPCRRHTSQLFTAMPRPIEPSVEMFVENPLTPTIHASTNLPDDSELLLTLSRPESMYTALTRVKVANGRFTTERFSARGRALNPGLYRVEISMSMVGFQPTRVQAVIGDRGQHLKGKFV